jgi:alkylation response protein AidB-like acyl-CoA dehydrogenase
VPVLLSTTKAERVDGGYRFTGRKHFGSLTPVWTRFGLHGMDTSNPSQPKIVHAFMPRDTAGYTIKETWDVLGMRATRSDDTVLENAFVPDRYVARVVPAGAAAKTRAGPEHYRCEKQRFTSALPFDGVSS